MGIPQKKECSVVPIRIHNDKNGDDQADMDLYAKQKHRNSLLLALYAQKNISHANLAGQLDISASGLNAVLKKINDVEEPLVKYTKIGKFKYYNLTTIGRRFVEEVIMPPEERVDLEHMREIWDIFQSLVEPTWEEYFSNFPFGDEKIADSIDNEIESVFCEFVNVFLLFYKKNPTAATAFIEELITSVTVRQSILAYAEKKTGTKDIYTVLNDILSQDDVKAYSFLDDLFDLSIKGNERLSSAKYNVTDEKKFMNMIQEIKSEILHAIVVGEKKDFFRDNWIKEGINRQLAFYAAEKYRVLVLDIVNRHKEGGTDK